MKEYIDLDFLTDFEVLGRGYLRANGLKGFDYLSVHEFWEKHRNSALAGDSSSILVVATCLWLSDLKADSLSLLKALSENGNNVAKALYGALLIEANEITKGSNLILEVANSSPIGNYARALLYKEQENSIKDELACFLLSSFNGFPWGAFAAARLLYENNKIDLAETLFMDAAKSGIGESYSFLASLASDRGDAEEEFKLLFEGFMQGDPNSTYGLGLKYIESGHKDLAEGYMRDAAICGHGNAAGELARLLIARKDLMFLESSKLFAKSFDEPFDLEIKEQIEVLDHQISGIESEAFYWARFGAELNAVTAYEPYSKFLEKLGMNSEARTWKKRHDVAFEEHFMREVFGSDNEN